MGMRPTMLSPIRYCLWLTACSVCTTYAAVCTSSEISVAPFARSFTIGSPTSTDVTMTIPIRFRTACTYTSFRKSIGLESDFVSSLTVTGGFNTSTSTTLRAQQYTSSSGYRFVRFYFPDGALPASGEVFTTTISYQLDTPLCRKDSSSILFQESWTHYWGCQCVDNWVHRLCVPPGTPLPPYNSVYGAPSTSSGSCYQWDHSSAPSTGLSIQLDTNLAADAPLCPSNNSSGDDNTLVIVLALCAAVAGALAIALLFYVCTRQLDTSAAAQPATQVPMAAPVHVVQPPPAQPGSQGFWQKAQPAHGAPKRTWYSEHVTCGLGTCRPAYYQAGCTGPV